MAQQRTPLLSVSDIAHYIDGGTYQFNCDYGMRKDIERPWTPTPITPKTNPDLPFN